MTEFKAIGRSTPLIDGRAKVTGAARYAADVTRPNMLHAWLVTSLYAHALVKTIDASAALDMPGVVAVLSATDLHDPRPLSRSQILLARGRVIYAGQPVAIVLAETEAAAQEGALLVNVDYEPLPAAITLDEALAEGAPLVWPDGMTGGEGDAATHGAGSGGQVEQAPAQGNVIGTRRYTRGDVAAGFAAAEVVIARTFTTSGVHQSSLETHGMVVEPDLVTGGAEVWASTQGHFDVRHEVALALQVPDSDVRVTAMTIGGGFGGKAGALYEPLMALAARAVGRPIRLILSRSVELRATAPAPATRFHLRLGATRAGVLTALEAEVWVDSGCYPFKIAAFLAMMTGSYYRVPNLRLTGTDVLTFKPPAGAYRAPGGASTLFALESLMDELATALGLDPLALRLQSAAQPGDLMADGQPWEGMGMRQVLEALGQHPAWQQRAQARAAGRGVGFAMGGWPGAIEPALALCTLNSDGRLVIHVGSVDLNGTNTSFALLAAEAFGVPVEQVRIIASDTETAPYGGVSAASKVLYTTGAAVVAAARQARQQTLMIASELLEAAVDDLEIVDGRVQVRGAPSASLEIKALARKSVEDFAPVAAYGRVALNSRAPAFGAQLAEVTVDRDTGEVTVERLVVVQDAGRAINPAAVAGQMLGGATQGLGWAMYEQMLYDEQGQLLTGSWMDYAVPNIHQAARHMETVVIEVPSEQGPFGARGAGEAPVVPTAAAIANAIADATGVRLRDLPITAPRLAAALWAKPPSQ